MRLRTLALLTVLLATPFTPARAEPPDHTLPPPPYDYHEPRFKRIWKKLPKWWDAVPKPSWPHWRPWGVKPHVPTRRVCDTSDG